MDWKIFDLTDKGTYPVNSVSDFIIFYIRRTNRMYLGHFDGDYFINDDIDIQEHSFHSHSGQKFEKGLVCCYIRVKDISLSDYVPYNIEDRLEQGKVYLFSHTIGPHDGFISLENNETLDKYMTGAKKNMKMFMLPELPVEVKTTEHIEGKYKWMLMDASEDGFYVYNFFKKCLFWWFNCSSHIVETANIKDGYNKAEEILKTYFNRDK